MISAIVYSRNDTYSYELNRRTAMGLNQLARQLDPARDEIVFVDYNTDNDLPTHPEAIADTLTLDAITLIRVIRVRPGAHDATRPGPPVREAICRNIALRRLAPGAEWVLSTNPDCLLVNDGGAPLNQLTRALPQGYFGLPRFELPRLVWEGLPRTDPTQAAAEALAAAKALALEEEVRHYLPAIGYDAPGDFQLARASDLIELAGFDEAMTQGWHVDSNMNARLALRHGALTDLNAATGGALKLFHAEHARRASAKHGAGRAEDPFEAYVTGVAAEIPAAQATSWGAPDETFEEFPLSDPPARRALTRLIASAGAPAPSTYVYGPKSFDDLPPGEDHLATFLIDHLAYAPPTATLGWFGEDPAGSAPLRALLARTGLTNPVADEAGAGRLTAAIEAAEILIIDAPRGAGQGGAPCTERAFAEIVLAERRRAAQGLPLRRIIGLNVPHSRFEAPFLAVIPSAMTPVATRIRFGEVATRDPAPIDLTGDFETGEAGQRTAEAIEAVKGREGYVALARRPLLPPGAWRLDFDLQTGLAWNCRIVLDIALDGEPVADVVIEGRAPGRRQGALTFTSGAKGLFGGGFECRLWADGRAGVRLVSARLQAVDTSENPERDAAVPSH